MGKQIPSKRSLPQGLYEYTLGEVAEELGLSRERVRQIEQRALEKLQKVLEARGYSSDDVGTEPEPDNCRVDQ